MMPGVVPPAALGNGQVGDLWDNLGPYLVPVGYHQVIGILFPDGLCRFDGHIGIGISRNESLAGMLVIHVLDHGRLVE
jgi:hypothetical protein